MVDRLSDSANLNPWYPSFASRIMGSGRTVDLIRHHPWEQTPLGALETWSESLLAVVNLMLSSPIPTCLHWGKEMVMIYNDCYGDILDWRHPAALGQPGKDVWTESWPLVVPQFDAVMARGKSITEEHVLIPIQSGGKLQDFFWNYSLMPVYENGKIAGVLNASQDVTGTVLTTRLLNASDERLRVALAAGNCVGTWDWNLKDNLLYADEQFALHYGADPKLALAGAPVEVFMRRIHPEDLDLVRKEIDRAIDSGDEYACEYRLVQEDDSIHWVAARGRCLYARDGSAERLRGVAIDITARKQTEAALLQSERLVAAGKFAATIAHEINNPLEAVTNLIYLARNASDPGEIQYYLGMAESEVHRASRISRQTLRLRKQAVNPQPVDCNQLIEAVLTAVRDRTEPLRIRADARCRATRPLVCLESEIRQVLLHLVTNAIDAMQTDDRRLLLRTREATSWSTGRRGIVMTIADTGSGMSSKTRTEIFDPFFSTKGHGGTGLGLWVSQQTVDSHQGTLCVRSSQREELHGTVITVFLPFQKP